MYPSLFFGEPSRAFYPASRAKPSFMVSKTEPKRARFFLSSVDKEIKAKICNDLNDIVIEFYDFNWAPRNFYINKHACLESPRDISSEIWVDDDDGDVDHLPFQ